MRTQQKGCLAVANSFDEKNQRMSLKLYKTAFKNFNSGARESNLFGRVKPFINNIIYGSV